MSNTLYATKVWKGDLKDVWGYHPNPDLVIANNLGFDIVDMGPTDEPYYLPELRAVKEAKKRKAKYILWLASDVKVEFDIEEFKAAAIPLLAKYPMVSPFWEAGYQEYVLTAKREAKGGFEETDFGFEEHFFSDQAYLAKVSTMMNIDYNCDHPIKTHYPAHGGNSFECRVAQWLSITGKKRAVLKDFKYKHTPRNEK